MRKIGAIFDIPFMIQCHAESMKKIREPFRIYQLTSAAIFSHNLWNWAGLTVLAGRRSRWFEIRPTIGNSRTLQGWRGHNVKITSNKKGSLSYFTHYITFLATFWLTCFFPHSKSWCKMIKMCYNF